MPLFLVNSYLDIFVIENVLNKTELFDIYSVLDTLNPVNTVTVVKNGNFVKASKNAI